MSASSVTSGISAELVSSFGLGSGSEGRMMLRFSGMSFMPVPALREDWPTCGLRAQDKEIMKYSRKEMWY